VNVAIHDANILIDIVNIGFAKALFSLDLGMRTTDAVWAELSSEQKNLLEPFVKRRLLEIDKFTVEEVGQIISYAQKNRALSFEDCSLIVAGRKHNALVITGDKKLRSVIESEQLEVHGILWLFDRMVEKATIDKRKAAEKLRALMNMNSRLPVDEMEERIRGWVEG
jgi:predicted nucleic acid-binding protein